MWNRNQNSGAGGGLSTGAGGGMSTGTGGIRRGPVAVCRQCAARAVARMKGFVSTFAMETTALASSANVVPVM